MPLLTESETKAMLKELMSRLPFRKHGLYCFCNGCTDERISLGIQADKDLIAELQAYVAKLKGTIEREAEYCYGWAASAEMMGDDDRAKRHRERGDRLMSSV